jgi:rubrerythrin
MWNFRGTEETWDWIGAGSAMPMFFKPYQGRDDWRCEYCGSFQSDDRYTCKQCGAPKTEYSLGRRR